jgi:hypothetical protein
VPKIGINLLSTGQLVQKGISLHTQAAKTTLTKAGKTIAIGYPKGNLTIITASYTQTQAVNDELVLTSTSTDINLMHERMGHIGDKALNALGDHSEGITLKGKTTPCDICISANQTRQISCISPIRQEKLLVKVYSDICGLIKPLIVTKTRYFATFIDDYSC